jgi:hypothetical protein
MLGGVADSFSGEWFSHTMGLVTHDLKKTRPAGIFSCCVRVRVFFFFFFFFFFFVFVFFFGFLGFFL